MAVTGAHRKIGSVYLGGSIGQLVSGIVWLFAAAVSTWVGIRQGISVLMVRREVMLPRGDGCESARQIWDGIFNRKATIIARCVGTGDVINAVNFARDNNLFIAVRGGARNPAENAVCDDGIMINLSLMRQVNLDPKNRLLPLRGGGLLMGGGA
jgi:hypothetical protein